MTYSAAPHKEFRFLLPALQLMTPHCGAALAHIAVRPPQPGSGAPGRSAVADAKAPPPGDEVRGGRPEAAGRRAAATDAAAGLARRRGGVGCGLLAVALVCVALQVPAALYFGLLHQR